MVGQRRGRRSNADLLRPELMLGGWTGGHPLRLVGVAGPSGEQRLGGTSPAVKAVKELRTVTGGSLQWSKQEVYDRVLAGETVIVTVSSDEPQLLDDLRAAGWEAEALVPDGMVEVKVQFRADALDSLREFVDKGGGKLQPLRASALVGRIGGA